MAYINQDQKAKIAASLKRVIPAGWKYSLAVRNHSTLVLTISEAPVDLLGNWFATVNARRANQNDEPMEPTGSVGINTYYVREQFSSDLSPKFVAILDAMNEGNHDRSDLQSDYHDVGWYTDIRIGKWDRPFVCTRSTELLAA